MKRITVSLLALCFVMAVKAQEIPERKNDFRPHDGYGKMHKRRGGDMDLKALNLTDAQKDQMKTQRENFRKQMDELKKNDNITVKEWKTRMENLRKEQKSKMESILTTDQKAKLSQMKTERKAMHDIDAKARLDKMKVRLGLSDEQAAKMEKNRKEFSDKMKALHENKSLSEEKKREEMKTLMKQQKDNMKSILTEEQLQKMKEQKHKGPHGPRGEGKKEDTRKETI
ncbi:MAG: hypothetical protein U0U70_09170 [Chitinophagaceae bacterium]